MLSINYKHTNYCNLIRDFAAKLEAPVTNDCFITPGHVGDGYFKYMVLRNRLQCFITDLKLNQDMYSCQKKSNKEFYVLRFNELLRAKNLMFKIDDEYIWEDKQQNTSVFLTSSLFDFAYKVSKGTVMKSINVLIPKAWLLKYIAIKDVDNADTIFKDYLMLKSGSYNFAPFDIEYRRLFNEIMNNQNDSTSCSLGIENCIIKMVEKFVNELRTKLSTLKEKNKVKISTDEMKRLIIVESYLVNSFSIPPPTIFFLSRVAAMSTTSLKNKFKKMFGSSLYEYFQKGRMQRAKVLMLTHKYSIKEIGSQLGYSNLSNFSIAFKKEFKYLPSHFLLNLAKPEYIKVSE